MQRTNEYLIIAKTAAAKVSALATANGVAVTFNAVTAMDVWERCWKRAGYAMDADDLTFATRTAGRLAEVVFTSDAAGDVLAIADCVDGAPVFFTFADGFKWTIEAMDAIDFKRCDRCGVRHARKKVYLVNSVSGVEQLGGTCAQAAASRLRAMLGFLSECAKTLSGFDMENYGATSAPSTHTSPALLLALASISIRENGYNKTSAPNPTKHDVAEAVGLLHASRPTPTERRAQEEIRAKLATVDRAQLLLDVEAWIATMQDGDFARNMAAAVSTGSLRLLGVLCYAPEGLARWNASQAQQAQTSTAFPYDPATDTSRARLASFSPDELKLSAKIYERAENGVMSKATEKKISRVLSGEWTITKARTWSNGFDSPIHFVTFTRGDGATVEWSTGTDKPAVGAVHRLTATIGDLRTSERYGNTRKISRATLHPVA